MENSTAASTKEELASQEKREDILDNDLCLAMDLARLRGKSSGDGRSAKYETPIAWRPME